MDPFIYQYGVGSLVFLAGLYVAFRQGDIGFSERKALRLLFLVVGLLLFMVIQGTLQYAPMETLPAGLYQGRPLEKKVMGTPIDYGVMILYFIGILIVGTYYGKGQKTLKDFFFAGRRFSWWFIAFSLVATTVGSYSFVKYSEVGFAYGLSSTQSYLNDWFWLPLLVFGWLPILYFSGITSIPEYFERRFGRGVRNWVTFYVLVYLIGYIGVNLFTMGKALNILMGWPIPFSAVIVASVTAIYVTAGGQTSVIMTDLFQGIMLLLAGLLILWLGIDFLGGLDVFWQHLPRSHRLAFANFNQDPSFNSVGIFWQDAIANSAMFYFLNQGMVMRFMSAKSLGDARKATYVTMLVLMPLAACVVASGGWVGKALEHAGFLPQGMKAEEVFFITSELLSRPGIFGFILAALIAALMSTIDSLITGVAAIVVNDVYRPYVRPRANEKELLRVARISSVVITLLGVLLVPIFMHFESIYVAHAAFTAAVTPPLVVTLMLSAFWKRFTKQAALCTLIGGMVAITISLFYPEVITPFAHGVPMKEVKDGFLSGMRQQQFMRAFYGLVVSGGIALIVTMFTRPIRANPSSGV